MSDDLEHSNKRRGGPSVSAHGRDGTSEDPQASPTYVRQRRNSALRTLVDGLLDHIRDLSGRVDSLTPEELETEHQRFNMMAELTWAVMTDEKNRAKVRSKPQWGAETSGSDTDSEGSAG